MNRSLIILPPTGHDVAYRKMQEQNFKKTFLLKDARNYGNTINLFKIFLTDRRCLILLDWFHMYYSHPNSLIKTLVKFTLFILWIKLANLLKIPVVVNLHNLKPHDTRWKRLDYLSYQYLLKNSELIRCFSEYNRNLAIRYFQLDQKKVIYAYENVKENEKSLGKNYDPKDHVKKTFLIIGQIRRYKNILDTLVQLRKKIQDNEICLRIIGNPYDEGYALEIENLISKQALNVEFIKTFLSDEEFDNEIIKSDYVIVSATRNYNSGILSKCISYKKPCIIKAQFGNTERMAGNKNYLIVNNDLNAVISNCLENKVLDANALYLSDLPSEGVLVKQMEDIYDHYLCNRSI